LTWSTVHTRAYHYQMPFYGGVYLPPARFAALSQQASEKDSRPREAYQKQSWDALRKSLNGLINKVTQSMHSRYLDGRVSV
jgi:hypothetical protein